MKRLYVALILGVVVAPAQAQPAPSAEDALRAALVKISEDDLEGAIALLEELREAGASTPRAEATLGALYLEIDLHQDAFDVLVPLAENDDADPAVLFNTGRAALALGEAERGERFLERSLARDPVSPAARLLGMRLGARGRHAASYRLLRPWALAHPEDTEARLAAAAAALVLERLPEAEELLAGLEGEAPRLRLLRAEAAYQRREPEATARLLEPLRDDAPPEMTLDVSTLLSAAYLELGRSADAVELLAAVEMQHPRLALARARALYQGGDVEAALETLEPWARPLVTGSLAAPPPGQASVALAVVLETGRFLVAADRAAEAVPALERATELDPWNREAWQELARAYAATDQREAAAAAAERLREIAAAHERAAASAPRGRASLEDPTGRRVAEAVEWLERGEGQRALELLRDEIALAPNDPRPLEALARVLEHLGQSEEARAAAAAAQALQARNPDP